MPDSIQIAGPAPVVVDSDSLALDSINMIPEGEAQGVVIFTAPEQPTPDSFQIEETPRDADASGMSWIYIVLAVLFSLTALRFKGSIKYLKALVIDMVDTRVRHNLFDDTVKETSLIVLLNIVWVACAGILCWLAVNSIMSDDPAAPVGVIRGEASGIALCWAVALGYICVMLLTYWIVGNVFSDNKLTVLWIKGAAASTGLEAFLLFPIAVIALNYPAWCDALLIMALIVFVAGKIIFLYKGFRIFFAQISSWLLFLYYLCSLEIIPVILTFVAMVAVCTT